MLSLSAAISPEASTAIERVRSPLVTAVATSAIERTWLVRLAAMLRSHCRSGRATGRRRPARAPARRAVPSTPTSRAMLVTWSPKVDSVSIMPLIVSASAAISPLASKVSLRLRLPCATAVTTSAMPRTWLVRLVAIRLTLSVRSFQVPPTPGTCAWPPSLPSVPTSRATRVTSEAKPLSWSTMMLMVFLSSRISPFTSTVIFLDRSPRATAVVTSAMLRTWPVRLSAMRLTLSVRSFHVPATPRTCAWPPSLPSVPTSRATRVTSEANELSWSTMVLMVFLSSRISPFTSTVIFLDKSPSATAVVTSAMLRTWPVRFAAMAFTLSVRSFQVPPTPSTCGLAAELVPRCPPRGPRASLRSEGVELVDHRVDGVLAVRGSRPSQSTVIFLRQVAPGHGGGHLGDVADLAGQVAGHARSTLSVRSFQVPPTPSTCAWPPRRPSVADFAGDAGTSGAKRVQLIDHRVDGVLELEDFAAHLDGDLRGRSPARDRGGHLGDVAHLAGQVGGHRD